MQSSLMIDRVSLANQAATGIQLSLNRETSRLIRVLWYNNLTRLEKWSIFECWESMRPYMKASAQEKGWSYFIEYWYSQI